MTTSEKITIAVSIAGALGVGALLQAWVTHLMQRRERKINIADKSIQIAETVMTRMENDMTRAQEAVAEARAESERLRTELAKVIADGEQTLRREELRERVQEVTAGLSAASSAMDSVQRWMHLAVVDRNADVARKNMMVLDATSHWLLDRGQPPQQDDGPEEPSPQPQR